VADAYAKAQPETKPGTQPKIHLALQKNTYCKTCRFDNWLVINGLSLLVNLFKAKHIK